MRRLAMRSWTRNWPVPPRPVLFCNRSSTATCSVKFKARMPERLHLALGNGEFVPFRVADFAAYERRIRSYLGDFLHEDVGDYPDIEPYPEPVEHCAICRWRVDCTKKRRDDDDLSLIAGMPTTQRVALKAIGVSRAKAVC